MSDAPPASPVLVLHTIIKAEVESNFIFMPVHFLMQACPVLTEELPQLITNSYWLIFLLLHSSIIFELVTPYFCTHRMYPKALVSVYTSFIFKQYLSH